MEAEATATSPDTEPPTWGELLGLCIDDEDTEEGPPLTDRERETVLANHRAHAGAVSPASGQAGPIAAPPPSH